MKTSPHLLPTIDELKELFSCDPETGIVTRRKSVSAQAKKGMVVGTLYPDGYKRVGIRGRGHYVHRIVWALHHGEWPSCCLDHRNGNRNDNRIANLRLATHAENMRNYAKPKTNTSGTKGVSWDKARCKWGVQISSGDKCIFLGRFVCKAEAAAAYAAASARLHGEFGRIV